MEKKKEWVHKWAESNEAGQGAETQREQPAEFCHRTMMATVLFVDNKAGCGLEDQGERADSKDIPQETAASLLIDGMCLESLAKKLRLNLRLFGLLRKYWY